MEDIIKNFLYSVMILAGVVVAVAFWYVSLLIAVIVLIIFAGRLIVWVEKDIKKSNSTERTKSTLTD